MSTAAMTTGERDGVVRSRVCHLDWELTEENLKIKGVCTITKFLMKGDSGNKERKVG